MTAVRFDVEHCTGKQVEKIRDDLATRAVQRAVFSCECGVDFYLTATMRPVPVEVDAGVLPLELA